MPGPYGVVWRGEDERGKGGRQPAPFAVGGGYPLTGCRGRLRAAYMPPLQSCRLPLRGFGGAWRRTTSAASLQANSLVRLFAPQGQTLLAPQFRCAQLWPRARNPATPEFKVEEGAVALRTKSNTAFV